ncbi:MAG: hypothetical protein IJ169_00780 [Paludibacteraceae bacterium]|nr:hypothetical protein [Paludibacteraceae bacterium]
MKKPPLSLFSLILLFCLVPLYAQEPSQPMRTPEQIAAKQTERLQRELTLTPQQRDTVYAIHLKYARMRSPEATHEEVQSRMEQLRAELRKVLTEEQYRLLQQRWREAGPRRHAVQRMMPRPAETLDTITAGRPQQE